MVVETSQTQNSLKPGLAQMSHELLSPRSRKGNAKALSVLGVDASLSKASDRLGVQVETVANEQATAAEQRLQVERERASLREITQANDKVRGRLGHDASKEKLKKLLALDDAQLASEFDSNRRDFVQRQVEAPACVPQTRVVVNAPSKAQRVVGFEPREASLAKVGHLLDLDQAEVADAQAGLVVGGGALSPALKDVLAAPEKAQRLVGFDSDDKAKHRLGLSDREYEQAQRAIHRHRADAAAAGARAWRHWLLLAAGGALAALALAWAVVWWKKV